MWRCGTSGWRSGGSHQVGSAGTGGIAPLFERVCGHACWLGQAACCDGRRGRRCRHRRFRQGRTPHQPLHPSAPTDVWLQGGSRHLVPALAPVLPCLLRAVCVRWRQRVGRGAHAVPQAGVSASGTVDCNGAVAISAGPAQTAAAYLHGHRPTPPPTPGGRHVLSAHVLLWLLRTQAPRSKLGLHACFCLDHRHPLVAHQSAPRWLSRYVHAQS